MINSLCDWVLYCLLCSTCIENKPKKDKKLYFSHKKLENVTKNVKENCSHCNEDIGKHYLLHKDSCLFHFD